MTMKTKRIAAFLVAGMMMSSVFGGSVSALAASAGSTISTTSSKATPSTISLNVQNADVRDVFSAIALNMGYSIIYTAEPVSLTLELENVKPDAAFEYILKILNMQYIAEGKTLIIGTRETLNANFRRSLSLTRFRLNYTTSAVVTDKIQQLDLPVTVITVETNERMLWVQGFAVDIGKVNDLIQLLDIPENAASAKPGDGTGATGKTLTYVTVGGGMTAYEFNRMLKTLGIECGLCLSNDGTKLYLYANSAEIALVNELLGKVNSGNYNDISAADDFALLSVNNISKNTAISSIASICPNLVVLSVDNSSKAFFVKGSNDDIQRAKQLLADIDLATMNSIGNTVNTYKLQHITAAEAERRMASVAFDDGVSFYTSTQPEFSTTLFVYCNEFYWAQITKLLQEIDVSNANGIGIPVFAGTAANVTTMQTVLSELLGTALTGATFKTVAMDTNMILYLSGADTALSNAVLQMISQINSVMGTTTNADLSYEAFLAYCKTNNLTNTDMASYGAWVRAQLSGKSVGGKSAAVPGGFSKPGAIPTPPVATIAPSTLVTQAESVMQGLFTFGKGSYVPTAQTNADTILRTAREALDAQNLSAVSLETNPEAKTTYRAPTLTATGELVISLKLSVGDTYSNYLVHVILPVTTCAVCGHAPCTCTTQAVNPTPTPAPTQTASPATPVPVTPAPTLVTPVPSGHQ